MSIRSMTGFGRASGIFGNKNFSVDIRSLNGKTTDIRCRFPSGYKEKEIEIRKIVMDGARRGKLEFSLNLDAEGGNEHYVLNKPLFKNYYNELKSIQEELKMEETDLMQAIIKIPNVIDIQQSEITDEEWAVTKQTIQEALQALDRFRLEEGAAMSEDLLSRVQSIESNLEKVNPFEEERIVRLRDKLKRNLENISVDENRYEQEILFYLEKLDINEEKVRLSQHCQYFRDILENTQAEKGKKLGFIAQEMGREINTLGAKAQDSDIQQLVVLMKDDLEKIKEQIANIV
jgi:uncharacterized protein (TIGR00255 family)